MPSPHSRGARSTCDAIAFAPDPSLVLADELFRFAARAAVGDGDAQRAVRTHAQDVAPGATDADELDHRMRLVDDRWCEVPRRVILMPYEGKHELHRNLWQRW